MTSFRDFARWKQFLAGVTPAFFLFTSATRAEAACQVQPLPNLEQDVVYEQRVVVEAGSICTLNWSFSGGIRSITILKNPSKLLVQTTGSALVFRAPAQGNIDLTYGVEFQGRRSAKLFKRTIQANVQVR